ncbi:MAG: hypothetical protein JSW39_05390 [Desulfobacterales bacterium]|nr:MAG: hypothetical protein JSW39_05390 [Desulfobacterales bacterium]
MSATLRSVGAVRVACAAMALMVVAAGCGSLQKAPAGPPIDENLERLNRAARLAFQKRQTEQAADLYRKALERAFVRGDLTAIVDARYNLAVCLMELGEYPQALDMIGQALSELSRVGRNIQADFHLLEATILYRDGQLSRSWELTDTIIGSWMPQPPVILSKTYFLRGLIAAAEGDAARLNEAIAKMGDASDDSLRADRGELMGRLAIIEGRWDQAIAALDEAADLRRQIFAYRRMAIALALSAEACERAGRPGTAAGRYLQAGRSAALEGDASNAEKWLSSAVRLSEQSKDPSIAKEARYHLALLAEKLEKARPDQQRPSGGR